MAPTVSKMAIVAVVVALFSGGYTSKVKKNKQLWCKICLLKRHIFSHISLLNEIRTRELIDFKNYLRMNDVSFNKY